MIQCTASRRAPLAVCCREWDMLGSWVRRAGVGARRLQRTAPSVASNDTPSKNARWCITHARNYRRSEYVDSEAYLIEIATRSLGRLGYEYVGTPCRWYAQLIWPRCGTPHRHRMPLRDVDAGMRTELWSLSLKSTELACVKMQKAGSVVGIYARRKWEVRGSRPPTGLPDALLCKVHAADGEPFTWPV